MDLGFDSIGLTNFANAINEKYQLDISPVLFFDYPSIGEIAKYLSVERESEIRRFYRGCRYARPDAAAAPIVASRPVRTPDPMRNMSRIFAIAELSPELRFVNEPIAIVGIARRHAAIRRSGRVVGES